MALFGKKRQATGQAMDLRPDANLQQQPQPPEQPRGGGLFRQGGPARGIAGTVGDFLMQYNGLQPTYAPAVAEQRKQAAALAEEQRKRSMGLEDYEAKRQIDQRYRDPADNIELREDNAGNMWQFDKTTGQPIGDKPVWVDRTPKEFVHEGMRFSIPNPFAGGQAANGGNLDATPATEDGYDYIPGPGGRANPANWKQSAGGGVSNGTGNFREAFADYTP